jgi:hypothetical protein
MECDIESSFLIIVGVLELFLSSYPTVRMQSMEHPHLKLDRRCMVGGALSFTACQ